MSHIKLVIKTWTCTCTYMRPLQNHIDHRAQTIEYRVTIGTQLDNIQGCHAKDKAFSVGWRNIQNSYSLAHTLWSCKALNDLIGYLYLPSAESGLRFFSAAELWGTDPEPERLMETDNTRRTASEHTNRDHLVIVLPLAADMPPPRGETRSYR